MSGLDNLRSVFQDELNEKVELFKENQPIDKFDTKFNYNQQALIPQSFTFGVDLNAPMLDSVKILVMKIYLFHLKNHHLTLIKLHKIV